METTREFKVSRKHLWGAAVFIVIFAAWTAVATYALLSSPHRPISQTWPAALITMGIPGGMMVMTSYFLLQLISVVEVSPDGVRMSNPTGSQRFFWTEAVRYDLFGTEESGIKVYTTACKSIELNFSYFDDAEELRQMILPNLPVDDGQDPLVSTMNSSKATLTVLLIFLGFMIIAGFVAEGMPAPYWVVVALFAALTLPIIAYFQTYRAKLAGNLLSVSSCFASK